MRTWVERLELTQRGGQYHLWFVTADGFETEMVTDGTLAAIMAAWSATLKALRQHDGGTGPTETVWTQDSFGLTEYRIDQATVKPLAWSLVMATPEWSYTALMDHDLESVISAYAGAMKFFAVKRGLTVLYPEVIRNLDAAHEDGFHL